MWSLILFVFFCFFCCVVVYRRLEKSPQPEYISYTIFILLVVMMGMILTEAPELIRAIELTHLAVYILTMVLLLITVRMLQPDYARHPVFYSYLPLIVLPFYAYFVDSFILAEITFLTVQATCLIVYAGIVIMYFKSLDKGYLLFISLLFFIGAFAVSWLIHVDQEWRTPTIHMLSGIGMITASFKFPAIINKHKRQ